MTDIYVCVALMAFGFAVLGTTWIIMEGLPVIRRYIKERLNIKSPSKYWRYVGKHEKTR